MLIHGFSFLLRITYLKGPLMDRETKTLIYIVGGLLFLNIVRTNNFHKRLKKLEELGELTVAWMEADYQEDIDERFEDIIDDLDM